MSLFFFFKQKTAYEMRISDWSSDVCSSDLRRRPGDAALFGQLSLVAVRRRVEILRAVGAAHLLAAVVQVERQERATSQPDSGPDDVAIEDRKSVVEGKRVSVRVDPGGGRSIKKKKEKRNRKHDDIKI